MFDRVTAKQAARDLGLTPRELAPMLGVSERQVWRYEAGRSEPPFSVAARMARVLGLALEDLYVHEPEPATAGNGRGKGPEDPKAPTDAGVRSTVGA